MRPASSGKRRRGRIRHPQQSPRPLSLLPVLKQLISIVLMLGSAAGLLVVLQILLAEMDLLMLVSAAIAALIRGVQHLFEALIGLGTVGLNAVLVVLIAVLLLGGSWRAWRLGRRLLRPRRQREGARAR